MTAVLYVVATPIGNLADMSERAIAVLREVDLLAAEDTRHSAVLMRHFAIEAPAVAYHEHSGEAVERRIATCWESGGSVALISDAGTPLISDPGYRLVRLAQALGVQVSPIPGACAAIAALSVSGLPTDRFAFEGFLPAKAQAREQYLADLVDSTATLVFYEAPHRVGECLQSMDKGESAIDSALVELMLSLASEMPPRKAAQLLADYSGVRKKRLYQCYLDAAQKR